MATNKILRTLCIIALVGTSFALPVDEVPQVAPVGQEQKAVVASHDVKSEVVGVVPVENDEQPIAREEPVQDPHVVVHDPQNEVKLIPNEPAQPAELQIGGGPAPVDLVAAPDANPGAEQDGADLETANTFGFGYRPWGYGGGWRRGWYGRGYGGYGGYGGWGGGYGGYYPHYGHGWGRGYGYWG